MHQKERKKQTNKTMTQKYPLYLLEFGMIFLYKKSTYTLCNVADNGMYEAIDKFGLIVNFNPMTAVIIK